MTRLPLTSDSATFSAAWRHTEQLRNSASPSFHSLVCLSNVRGVEATVKFATAAPEGVNRSSGSLVRLPITVIGVSPAMKCSWWWCRRASLLVRRSNLTLTADTGRGSIHRRTREGPVAQRVSGRITLVRSTDSFSVSWRSSSLTVAGSASRSMTA